MIPRYGPTYTWADLLTSLYESLTGNPLEDLSSALAHLYAVKHVFLFGGARMALYALLRAYNRPGGVLLPAYNCIAVPEAVLYAGYHPVFADIGYHSVNMTASSLEQSFSRDVTAVLITHQFGIPCEVDEIVHLCRRHEFFIIEDAAAAIGAKFRGRLVGTFGDAAIISFHMSKIIAGGIGGALLTNDDDLARRVDSQVDAYDRTDRWSPLAIAVGWKALTNPFVYPAVCFGYRALRRDLMFEVVAPHIEMPKDFFASCSRFSAALVLAQLDRLESNLNQRRKVAQLYKEQLSGCSVVTLPTVPEGGSPSWMQFPVLVTDKHAFYEYMQCNGIDLSWTFRYSCADSFGLDGFPISGLAAQRVLGLPTYPALSHEKALYICSVIKSNQV